jgi:hypothetical protein
MKSLGSVACTTLGLAMFCAPSIHAQDHRRVDCNAQFKFEQSKFTISATVVKGIQGSVGIDPQVLAQLDKWTTLALDQQRALCDAYKNSSETAFPTPLYLQQLDTLRAWEIDFFKAILTLQNINDTKSGKGNGDLAQLQSTLNQQLNTIVSQPAKPDLSSAPEASAAYKAAIEKLSKK